MKQSLLGKHGFAGGIRNAIFKIFHELTSQPEGKSFQFFLIFQIFRHPGAFNLQDLSQILNQSIEKLLSRHSGSAFPDELNGLGFIKFI
jgi:hypothetical protein